MARVRSVSPLRKGSEAGWPSRLLTYLFLVVAFAASAAAGTFDAFGPRLYTRDTGAPVPVTQTFRVRTPNTRYTLIIEQSAVSSAVVVLNGSEIFGPHDFNNTVEVLSKDVALMLENTLTVELRGTPGEGFRLRIAGLDDDAPIITATATPAPNAAGWNNGEVTVSFACDDVISGVAHCPASVVVTAEGADQLITGTAIDVAGNSAAASVTLDIDRSAPVITIASPADGATVSAAEVEIHGSVVDALSGAGEISCNGTTVQVLANQFTCTAALVPGPNVLSFAAADAAGNSATASITVQAAAAPIVQIVEPSNLSFVNISPVTVRGTVSDRNATVTVSGITTPLNNGMFSLQVPLVEGNNNITAVAQSASGQAGTGSVQVTLDTTPPHVAIYSPADGFVTTDESMTVSGLVNDIVVGTVNDQQAQVTVNGLAASVANRSFLATNVPLALGENLVRATARDRVGNAYTAEITIRREAASGARISASGGDAQTAPIGTLLPLPLTARLVDAAGQPVSNRTVVFRVVQSDGTLGDLSGSAGGRSSLAATSDGQGFARASYRLGTRAGAGNNRVEATSTGFAGTASFVISATSATAYTVNFDAGAGQTGATGRPLTFPFVAVVTDSGSNRLGNVPVTFRVREGGGNLGGLETVTRISDSDGRALAILTLGEEPGYDNNLVEATVEGVDRAVVFSASARVPGNAADTRISGIVLDNSNLPLPGVTMRVYQAYQASNSNVPIPIGTPVLTDEQGQFVIQQAPVGAFKLVADGTTVQRPSLAYPTVEYDIVTVAGQDNTIGSPVFLPALDTVNRLCVNATLGGTLTLPSVPGFSFTVAPGSATFPGGSRTGCITVTPVHGDKVPMVPGFGQQPRFVITIQPAGTHFNPPAQIAFPNVDGLAPRQVTEMYSYDHDLSAFVAIGTGTVSADGSVLRSDPGVGVLKAGWHCGGNPSPTGAAATCPECKKCENKQCVADAAKNSQQCNNDHCKECNNGNCGAITGLTITITKPPDNPNPPDLGDNFSFLAQRSYSATATGDTIEAEATLNKPKDTSKIEWTVTPTVGAVRQETPADRKGPTFSFIPDPAAHPAYVRGTGCGNPGNGSCAQSTALSYAIKAKFCSVEDTNTIKQDQTDVIRQEYANHGIDVPGRGEFAAVTPTANFTAGEINTTSYTIILGTPGNLAQSVRDAYNQMIHDDQQVVPFGTTGAPATAQVVRPGGTIQVIGAILTTPRCNGAPNPATCDDVLSGTNILAGANGIVETRAMNQATNFPVRINSTWRNPERNEAVNGVLNSRHQYGNAADLDITAAVAGLTTAQLFCILQTAADTVGNGFAENFSTQVPCNASNVTHVHVQQP